MFPRFNWPGPVKTLGFAAGLITRMVGDISFWLRSEAELIPYRLGLKKERCFRCDKEVHINDSRKGAMVHQGYVFKPRNVENIHRVMQVTFCKSCAEQGTVFEWRGAPPATASEQHDDTRIGKRRTDIEGKLNRL